MIDDALVRLSTVFKDDTSAEVIEKMATKTIYSATTIAAVGGFTMDEWGVFFGCAGVFVGVITLLFNIWFKMQYLRPKKRGNHKLSDRRKSKREATENERKTNSIT